MKKFFLISACVLCIACTKQYYDSKIVNYHNYPYPKPLCIDTTNCSFLTNEWFDAKSCDTILLHRLNRETEVELAKRINEMFYESEIRSGRLWQLNIDSLYVGNFFLYGKLDLQPNVKSLILLEYGEDTFLTMSYSKFLWLVNIKNNKLYSIARLDNYFSFMPNADIGQCVTTVSLKNKIFTETRTCIEHFFKVNIGEREWNSYKSKGFVKYRVNEKGYIEFVK